MKNKIVGICVCMLLITTCVLPIVGSDTKNTAITTTEKKDCGCSTNDTNHIRIFPPTVMREITQLPPRNYTPPNIPVIETPAYFNWRDYAGKDWTTPARNQGTCGSCWVFAALGALESVINIREGIADLDPDLSEQYVLSCLPKAGDVENKGCFGGWSESALEYIIRNDSDGDYHNGVILESCSPYKNSDPNGDDMWGHYNHEPAFCEKCENWENHIVPILGYGTIPGEDRALVKSTIMQIGPVAAYMLDNLNFDIWIYSHHSPDDYYPYESVRGINHVVTIVGWKDDPSIGKGGYWICKNSFGPNVGYNGFFNIEYGSLGIEKLYFVWVDYDPASYDWHPVPKANGPYYTLINTPVQFKGAAAGEHPPFIWHWDFGDQTTSEQQNPTHLYSSPGKYNVTLTVTDNNKNSFSDTTTAWVQETNRPPAKPSIDGPSKIKKGNLCFYNITVNDPDGSDVSVYFEAFDMPGFWSGLIPNDTVVEDGAYWREKGNYTVRAKAKDSYGAESDWATLIVSVPFSYNIPTLLFWEQLFERFPHAFPLLRHLMGY